MPLLGIKFRVIFSKGSIAGELPAFILSFTFRKYCVVIESFSRAFISKETANELEPSQATLRKKPDLKAPLFDRTEVLRS